MTNERFEILLQRLLDRELEPGAADELAAVLRADPARRSEVRQHLVLWELWSQQQAAERSAEAFVAAFRTRFRAEREADGFVAGVKRRIEGESDQPAVGPRWWEHLWLRRRTAAWLAASTVSAAVVVLAVWLTLPHPARAAVTLRGEAVCTACMLHETHAHLPAILVHDGAKTAVYYVESDRATILNVGDYCMSAVPIVATGQAEQHGGRRTINVNHAERDQTRSAKPTDLPPLIPF